MRWDGGIFNGIGGNDWEWLGMWSHVIPTVHITPLDSVRVFTRWKLGDIHTNVLMYVFFP